MRLLSWVRPNPGLAALVALAALAALFLIQPAQGEDGDGALGRTKRVMVVGIDGCRPDGLQSANTPNMDALIACGSVTYRAFAGGKLGTPTQQVTSSGPGWASFLTGVWRNKHGVSDNSFAGSNFGEFPHFFRRVSESDPEAVLASFVSWGPIDDSIVSAVDAFTTHRAKGIGSTAAIRDRSVRDQVVAYLANNDPEVTMLHFDQVDIAGHSVGYNAAVQGYLTAISNVDQLIGDVIAGIKARPNYADEDWLVVISTDHGGLGTSHGGQSVDERTIFLIASREGNAHREFTSSPGHTAVPPTVMKFLGLPIDLAWGWEDEPFGLPPFCPKNLTCQTDPIVQSVMLRWSPGEELDIEGIEVLRDGEVVAILGAEDGAFEDWPPVPGQPGLHEFAYTVRAFGGEDSALCDPLTCTASFFTGAMETDLVLHLAFEGNTNDTSGNGNANHGTLNGDAKYKTGVSGSYLDFVDGSSVDLGSPEDLQFGASTDFTVSVMVNSFLGLFASPQILSNQNGTSNTAHGWSIAGTPAGGWQWSMGDGAQQVDFRGADGEINDGRWHHIAVTHQRGSQAVMYFDGRELASKDIARIDEVISGLPTVVANHGSLDGSSFPGGIDEVMIWRRALFPHELRDLFASYDLDRLPDDDAVVDLKLDGDSADTSGNGNDGSPVGSPVFEPGISGQSIGLDVTATPRQYLSLGTSADLDFGEHTDFSVSVWVLSDGNFEHDGSKNDPAIIANKNWRSGNNPGWIIAAGGDGRLQWNISGGTQASRRDYDGPAGQITDGIWHHILVSHDRDGLATFYFDGETVATRHIDEVGDIDAGLPTAIGTDGLFGADWPAWFNGNLDNLQIWRRVVPESEVSFIYSQVEAYQDWLNAHFTTAQLADPDVSGPYANPDMDSWVNLQEFAFGWIPLSPTPGNPLAIHIDGHYVHLTYRRRIGGLGGTGVDYTADGVTYTLERSLDGNLDTWESGTDIVDPVGLPVPNGDGTESVTVRSLLPILVQGRQYFRLRLEGR